MGEASAPWPEGLTFEFVNVYAETFSLAPRLRVDHRIRYYPRGEQRNLVLDFRASELLVKSRRGDLYVASHTPRETMRLPPGSSFASSLFFDLDHYKLSQMEKVREGGNLQGRVNIHYIAELEGLPGQRYSGGVSFYFEIPKSKWVEEILPQLGYKEVSLIEIPKIEKPELSEVVAIINNAWKFHSMGEYKQVLGECRRAMEGLTTFVKRIGFSKEVKRDEGKEEVPDWEKALGHKDVGDIIGAIVQKVWGFLALGAHYGKSINKEDAELAIMTTHAIVNFIAKKITK